MSNVVPCTPTAQRAHAYVLLRAMIERFLAPGVASVVLSLLVGLDPRFAASLTAPAQDAAVALRVEVDQPGTVPPFLGAGPDPAARVLREAVLIAVRQGVDVETVVSRALADVAQTSTTAAALDAL